MLDVYFNFPVKYDNGVRPSVGVAGQAVVEVHQSQGASTLWYHVGSLIGNLVDFGSSQRYDDGINPAVAVNAAGIVVEVHETQSPFSSGMYYHVGRVDGGSIAFGKSHGYDDGNHPRVALNDNNIVVEVHEANGASSAMWYHVGVVDPEAQKIDFGGSHKYDSGATPSIAINNANVVVEVHRSQGASSALWYRVGVVDADARTIVFGDSHNYDNGAHPSVALTDDGLVIEVHQSQTFNTLWKRIGRVDVDSRTIAWIGGSVEYSGGSVPTVATDGAVAVQVNQDGTSLCATASPLIDRASWMADNLALLGERTLMQIAMPASHDAGMGTVQDCRMGSTCNTRTQNLTILDQLQAGSRYFDVRPILYNGSLFTGHYSVNGTLGVLGCNGQSLADVLADVNAYLAVGKDLVVLKFSHYFDRDSGGSPFDDRQMKQLLDEVTTALDPHLFKGEVPAGGLQSLRVRDFIADGGKVLAVFDGLSVALKSAYEGVYSYADKGGAGDLVVFDQYANSNDLGTMSSDQLGKLDNPANHGANLFLLSWTLTQDAAQAVGCSTGVAPSILTLANTANVALWPSLVAALRQGRISPEFMANLIYTDDVQGVQTDFAIWLNQQIALQSSR